MINLNILGNLRENIVLKLQFSTEIGFIFKLHTDDLDGIGMRTSYVSHLEIDRS